MAFVGMLGQIYRFEDQRRTMLARSMALIDIQQGYGTIGLDMKTGLKMSLPNRWRRNLIDLRVIIDKLKPEPGEVIGGTFDNINTPDNTKAVKYRFKAGLNAQLLLIHKWKPPPEMHRLNKKDFNPKRTAKRDLFVPLTGRDLPHLRDTWKRFLFRCTKIGSREDGSSPLIDFFKRHHIEVDTNGLTVAPPKPENSCTVNDCKTVLAPLNLGENHRIVGVGSLLDQLLSIADSANHVTFHGPIAADSMRL
mmetsp:Transcript_18577/g.27810  ORF Transcript_18577/g.27810 Transcript_18577/m.27810 type:complete len:250 (+) Transcript_18577:888-1637(+)